MADGYGDITGIGGQRTSRKIMIALDESIEAMRGVSAIAALAANSRDIAITICHCLSTADVSQFYDRSTVTAEEEAEGRRYLQDKFSPYMDEASRRFTEAGVDPANISRQFLFTKSNPLQKVIEVATTDQVGTIVVGRRDYAGFMDEHFRGRFSERLISSINNIAVWVSG